MPHQSFFLRLLIFSALVAAALGALQLIPALSPYSTFTWASWGFFIVLTALIYLLGIKAAKHPDKQLFVRFFLVVIGIKMLLSILLVMFFKNYAHPTDNLFVLPFFLIYVFYTIFEVYYLEKIAK